MADQLPAGAPRVSPARDSLAASYARLTSTPPSYRTGRIEHAGYIMTMIITFYVVIEVLRRLG